MLYKKNNPHKKANNAQIEINVHLKSFFWKPLFKLQTNNPKFDLQIYPNKRP